MSTSEAIILEKINKFIKYLKEQKYEELELELKEFTKELILEKEEFVKYKDLKLFISEMKAELKLIHTRFDDLIRYSDKRFEDMNKRFEDMNKRFQDIIHYIDKRFEDMNKRFDDVNKRFDDVNKRFDDVNKRFDDVNKRLNFLQWLIGILFSVGFTILTFLQNQAVNTNKQILEELKQIKIQSIQKNESGNQ